MRSFRVLGVGGALRRFLFNFNWEWQSPMTWCAHRSAQGRFYFRSGRVHSPVWTSIGWVTLLALAGCKAQIPSGIFGCEDDAQCPTGFVCERQGDDSKRYCFHRNSGSNDRAVLNTTAPVSPSSTRFSAFGGLRTDGKLKLYDDGFEPGERRCTEDGNFCAIGALEP